jgi:hypothetical protein
MPKKGTAKIADAYQQGKRHFTECSRSMKRKITVGGRMPVRSAA